MTITSLRPSIRLALGLVALAGLPGLAAADIVTGTDKTVAELKAGAYQLQLPPGRYKARCLAPTQREQEFLSLSEPVTVNVDCS
jgi:hypothetical protein